MPADDGLPRAAQAAGLSVEGLGGRVARAIRAEMARLDTDPGTATLAGGADARRTAQGVSTNAAKMLRSAAALVVDDAEIAVVDAVGRAIGSAALSPKAIAHIEAVTARELRRAESVIIDGAEDVRRLILGHVRAKAELLPASDDVASRVDALFARARSGVDAAVMAGGRLAKIEVAEEQAEEPMGYLYLGPLDGKTRPFCRLHVGKVYTRDALDALDNGDQPKPVSAHLGGHGCRHIGSPITLKDAREQGYRVFT